MFGFVLLEAFNECYLLIFRWVSILQIKCEITILVKFNISLLFKDSNYLSLDQNSMCKVRDVWKCMFCKCSFILHSANGLSVSSWSSLKQARFEVFFWNNSWHCKQLPIIPPLFLALFLYLVLEVLCPQCVAHRLSLICIPFLLCFLPNYSCLI